ncbi:MAG: hypothetical protein B6U87_00595 [Candidatus Aenigmarchaeota archaeon ex4484_52]|nr:MAG: hypothetical protein B6U87_00595 [Candidatus Aenigmarchaeota archaeon ex4484_52]
MKTKKGVSGNVIFLLKNNGQYTFSKEEMQNIEVYFNNKYNNILRNIDGYECNKTGLSPTKSCQFNLTIQTWPEDVG